MKKLLGEMKEQFLDLFWNEKHGLEVLKVFFCFVGLTIVFIAGDLLISTGSIEGILGIIFTFIATLFIGLFGMVVFIFSGTWGSKKGAWQGWLLAVVGLTVIFSLMFICTFYFDLQL